ncbi:hypothetical protein AB0L40_00170 [Patulibacter sp. NPDC049589]|uniref:hypothetical protein n=1 Tax=Patulibacter sp. NPDC049589 TaxID=3154731 RepID=UPI00342DC45F
MSTSPYLPADDPRAATCASCGAPMASDQRYCLSCGARREHARLPFQDAIVPVSLPGGPQAGAFPPALWSAPQGSGPATATLLAALACVLLAFGVGVLVGDKGGGGGAQQPIVLGGAPAASAAAPTPTTTETTAATDTTTDDASASAAGKSDAVTKIDKSKLDATQKKEAAEIEKTPATTPKAAAIPDTTEKNLNSKDPDKAREASQSLPDSVSTGP